MLCGWLILQVASHRNGNYMGNKLIPNSTQIPHLILREWLPQLSDTELRVVLIISDQTFGWHKDSDYLSYSQLRLRTGSSNGSIATALKSLREKGLIKVMDKKGKQIKTKEEARIAQELYYQINATSPKIRDHVSKNWTPKIGDTKDTYTKTLTNVRDDATPNRGTSCPLLSDSSLKGKWPRGHVECAEYVTTFKFVNKGKQFKFLHSLLRAGYDFPDIDKIIARVIKKPFYKDNGWDFATLASEADRSSNANS